MTTPTAEPAAWSPGDGCQGCGAKTHNDLVLCGRCVKITQLRLGDIPALVDALEMTIARQSRGGGSGGHRTKGYEQPLPFDMNASTSRSLINLLVEWSDVVAQGSQVPGLPLRPNVALDAQRVRGAVAIMLSNPGWFRTNTQAGDAYSAIAWIRNSLQSAVDRPPERLWAGPCTAQLSFTIVVDDTGDVTVLEDQPSTCGLHLYRKWGEDVITCDGYRIDRGAPKVPGCGATYSITDRNDFLVDSIEDQMLPLKLVWESLYHLLPERESIDWETVRKWPRGRRVKSTDTRTGKVHVTTVPPRIEPRAITLAGVELFRGGDILDLARDEAPRKGRKRKITRRGKAAS